MKFFAILSALLLTLSLYTSASHASEASAVKEKAAVTCDKDNCKEGCDGTHCEEKGCKDKACATKAKSHAGCDKEKCKEGCDGTQCEKNGCKGKACALKTKKRDAASTTTKTTTTTATTGVTSTTTPGAVTTTATNYKVELAKGEMHCADCAKKVSEALKSLPNVDQNSVKVILSKNTATLQVAPGSTVNSELIKKTIEDKTGYTVSKVEEMTTSTTTTK